VYLEVHQETYLAHDEGLTNENGVFTLQVKSQGIHLVKAHHSGYVELEKQFNVTKGFLAHFQDGL